MGLYYIIIIMNRMHEEGMLITWYGVNKHTAVACIYRRVAEEE